MERTQRKPTKGKRGQPKHIEMILSTLRHLGRPASAYDIQAKLAAKEHLAPPTIYRALDRLIEDGTVHKVESLNAFVACTHGCHREPSVFAICDQCGSVAELKDHGIAGAVDAWSKALGLSVTSAALELHGSCNSCNAGATA